MLGKTVDVHGLHETGRDFLIELSLAESWIAGEPVFTAIIRDITECKRAEATLEILASLTSH